MRERLLAAESVQAIEWRDDALYLLDQRLLPHRQVWLRHDGVADVAQSLRAAVVSGTQAVAITVAYGLVLAARGQLPGVVVSACLQEAFALLAAAQPSADIDWVLQRLCERLQRLRDDADALVQLEAEAQAIHAIDREANLTMAQLGAELIRKHQKAPQSLLLHCGAGALATGGFGVALGVVRCAHLESLVEQVYVDEARPWVRGAQLAAWELERDGVPVALSVDGAAAHLMKTRGITWVIVEAQRITANGDVLARVGTYQLAVTAMHHGLRFMVVAPSSVIDMAVEAGEDIVPDGLDEERLRAQGELSRSVMADSVFDVTPADLVDCIVTERGLVERPDEAKISRLMCRKRLH